jgi:HrpA-like RNA helicase
VQCVSLIFLLQDEVLRTVASSQVMLLSGETGCGKTTQVPQFLLEDAIARGQGGHIRIVCTQVSSKSSLI